MRSIVKPLAMTLLLAAACTAYGAGGGEMPSRPMGGSSATPTPEDQALSSYNAGVRDVEKADELSADAARQGDAKAQAKGLGKAKDKYSRALKEFTHATSLNPSMYQAWNYVGYTNRKLGNYEDALTAYDHALRLKPDYAEAIEYRGHAYLGLNRLSEAKDAYLALFSGNRKLAAQLLTAMQAWVGDHRTNPAGVEAPAVEAFASWVSERSTIASQTASLTREGASARW